MRKSARTGGWLFVVAALVVACGCGSKRSAHPYTARAIDICFARDTEEAQPIGTRTNELEFAYSESKYGLAGYILVIGVGRDRARGRERERDAEDDLASKFGNDLPRAWSGSRDNAAYAMLGPLFHRDLPEGVSAKDVQAALPPVARAIRHDVKHCLRIARKTESR